MSTDLGMSEEEKKQQEIYDQLSYDLSDLYGELLEKHENLDPVLVKQWFRDLAGDIGQ